MKGTMYRQIQTALNEEFNFHAVSEIIKKYADQTQPEKVLFDIGAGLSPFKQVALDNFWTYKSQDFGNYKPESKKFPGLQSESWDYPSHDIHCDNLEIPGRDTADFVLCTEVFEHIPNPIAALAKIRELTKPGGYIVITVPFASLMHQAPYWFQSGLSPYWFEYWSNEFKIEVIDLIVYGDYIDVMAQEVDRLTRISFLGKRALIGIAFKVIRKITRKEVLESLGHGVIFIGRKPK